MGKSVKYRRLTEPNTEAEEDVQVFVIDSPEGTITLRMWPMADGTYTVFQGMDDHMGGVEVHLSRLHALRDFNRRIAAQIVDRTPNRVFGAREVGEIVGFTKWALVDARRKLKIGRRVGREYRYTARELAAILSREMSRMPSSSRKREDVIAAHAKPRLRNKLTDRQRQMIELRYRPDAPEETMRSFRDVGYILGVSRQAVYNSEQEAMAKLFT